MTSKTNTSISSFVNNQNSINMNQLLTHAARMGHLARRTGNWLRSGPMLLLTALFLMGVLSEANAQITPLISNFETTVPTTLQGWTNSGGGFGARTTSLPCSGVASFRLNTYTTGTITSFVSPALGASNGALVTVSFSYKVTNWSAGTVATPANWGTMSVEYATAAGGPWTNGGTINSGFTQHVPATTCTTRTVTFTPPATASFFVRFRGTYNAGDYWFYLDNINISQAAGSNCAGTPNAGTATSPVPAACSGANFTVSATGLSTTAGITRQWQSSTDGGATWNNITGATGVSATVSQTVATQYRVVSLCSFSGLTNTSSAVSVSMLTGACQCATYPAAFATSVFDEDISNVTVGTMNNSSTCAVAATGPGSVLNRYANYTASVAGPTAAQGASVNFSLTQTSCGGPYGNFFQLYVDWNQNGSFADVGDQVYSQPTTVTGNQTVTGSFIVPATATPGATRMRVVNVETAASLTNFAQNAYTYGETEDYCFTVSVPPPCAGTPAPGNTLSSVPSACASVAFNLSLQNVTSGAGVTYQWQSSPDNVTWTDISGATLPTRTQSQTGSTWYRCQVTCTASGLTGTSNALQVALAPFYFCSYCPSAATIAADEDITNVTLGTLNNNSACNAVAAGPGSASSLYNNYRTTVAAPNLPLNGTISASVGITGCNSFMYATGARVFIDYNQDGDFTDAGEDVFTSPSTTINGGAVTQTLSGSFTVPCNALLGTTGMRVVISEQASNTIPACGAYAYGETEDYLVNITPDVSGCSGTPASSNTQSTAPNACPATNFTLSLSATYPGCDYTFQWQRSVDGGVTYSNFGAPAVVATLAVTGQTVTTFYQCVITCNTSGLSTTSTPIQVTQNTLLSCYCASSATSTIDEEIFNVTLGSINNTTNCASVGGAGSINSRYNNYTALQTTLTKTATYSMNVGAGLCPVNPASTTSFPGEYVHVWIDFNGDGTYSDATELVYRTAAPGLTWFQSGSTNVNFNFTVPAGAVTGAVGMRVIAVYQSPTQSACGTYTFGETEDYSINLVAPPVCAGTPTPGTLPGTLSVIQNTTTTLETTGLQVEQGLAYQWEQSPNGVTWSPVVGGTGATTGVYTTPSIPAGTIWYRLTLTCTNSGLSASSNGIQITTIGGATCAAPFDLPPTFTNPATPFSLNLSSNGAGNDLLAQTSNTNYGGSGEDLIFRFTVGAGDVGNYEFSVVNTSNTRFIGWFLKTTCDAASAALASATSTDGQFNSAHGIFNITAPGTYFLIVDYRAPVTSSNVFVRVRKVPAAPANDNCAGAVALTQAACAPTAGSMAGATASATPVICAGGNADDDIWYSFVATAEAAIIDLQTTNNGVVESGADVAFEMYTGTCAGLTALVPSCYNASASRGLAETATITSGLSVGTTYYIRVYDRGPGYGSANGNITICVAPPPPPANDNCSGATVLAVGGSCTPTAGITISATQSQPAVACNGFTGNADDDVWYSFTVAANTLLDIQVTPTVSTFDPVVQLFTGNSCALTAVDCADNSLRGGFERVSRTVAPGEYYVRVYHYGAGTGGGGGHTICVSTAVPPVSPQNDNTCDAIPVVVEGECVSQGPYESQTATRTLTWPAVEGTGFGDPSDDVWFKFTTDNATTSISIKVQGGGGYNPVIQLYTFTDCKTINLTAAPRNATGADGLEEQIVFNLPVNTLCMVRVHDFNVVPSSGFFTICVAKVPAPPNDAFANAELLTMYNSPTCPGVTQGYTVNATIGDATATCGTNDDNVWYEFVATNTTATISVTGSQNFDPAVDLRGGAGVGTSIQCVNASGANGTETINATGLTIGQVYKIQVMGVGTNPAGWGTFSICVFGLAAPPSNDNCAGAIILPNSSPCTAVEGYLTGATASPVSGPCSGTADDDVWYRFIASSTQATITVVGGTPASVSDMVVEMFAGSSCGVLTSIGCVDADPAPGTENLVVNGLTPGSTYYVRLFTFSSTGPGTSLTAPNPNFSICFTGVPPANDNICGAQNVTVSSNLVNINSSNLGATNNTFVASPAPFTGWNNDVWYKCTIPSNGVVAITVTGVGFKDTKIRAYTSSDNTCNGTITLVGADDDSGPSDPIVGNFAGSFVYLSGLTPGNTLFFGIDGFSAANFGTFRINVNDGWLWTGTTGFNPTGAQNWVNLGVGETSPNPFTANTVSGTLGSWSTTPGTTVINVPAVSNTPLFTTNETIGGVKLVGSTLIQSKITINSGSVLTLNGTLFAGSGRGVTGIGAGGRFEGGGRLDIGAQTAGQTVTINSPTRFRLRTTVLASANVQSNGNMIFDNASSLYSGQAGPNSLVNGNITYRRQGNTSQYVYNFWSSPLTNGFLSSLAAPGYIPNLYQYNTATATGLDYLGTQAGWQALTPSTAMVQGKGYIATGAGLANFTGLPQQSAVNISGQTGGGGNNFNCIGNPYPAPISASSFLTTNAASISGGAMYIWDDDATGGASYDDGDFLIFNNLGTVNGPNSGAPFSGNIAACQGFFVNYSGSGSFSFTNAMKTYGTNSEFFDITTANRLRLRMENVNGVGTETLLAFIDDATDGVDNTYDALRLQGNAALSLYTFNGDLEYAIQAWPTLTNERVIDLGAVNTVAGNASIRVSLYENFDPTAVVYLEDIELGIFHNLTQDNSYEYVNSGLDGETLRFRLHFRAPIGVSSVMDCSGTESGKILVGNPNTTPVAVELKNANNEVVATSAPFVGEHEFVNLASGNYSLEMSYTDGGIVNRTTAVENNGMTTPASFIASATSVSIADAIIEFQGNAQGATEYTWDFGDGTIVTGDLNPVHAYNALGVYTVTFTAMNNGCGSSATTTVTVGADLTGTNNVASASGFSIFPNPAANAANLLLNLDASESSVVVSINDAAGRLVSTKEINDVRSGAVVGLDVDKLANGVYQVTVEGTNFKNVGRLTIAK